jgi:uncharacterized protein
MPGKWPHTLISWVLSLLSLVGCAQPWVSGGFSGVAETGYQAQIHSWKYHKERNVVMQSMDFSCGSAALATLMKYRFDDDVVEGDLLVDILKSLSEQEVNDRVQNGLSLLDLKICAERRGYQAIGVKLKPSDVFRIKEPMIVHLQTPEYKHFAVLKGVRYDRALLADPNRGNVRMAVGRLWQEWSSIALILARPGSRLPTDYPLAIQDWDAERTELLGARRALAARQ